MKPKILVFQPFCPLPQNSGGKTRIVNTLKFLSQKFSIKLIAFSENNSDVQQSQSFYDELNIEVNFFRTVPRKIFSYMLTGVPYWFAPWFSSKVTQNIDFSKYQTILVELTQLLYAIDKFPKNAHTVFVAHDISTVSFWRRLKEGSMLKKIVNLPRLIEVYLYEKKYLAKYSQVIAVSQNDADILKRVFHLNNVIVSENGIESINFLPATSNPDIIKIGFIGSTAHSPNKTALNYLISQIKPILDLQKIKYKIVLVTDKDLEVDKNIECLGNIKNVFDFYSQIDVLVAPIFSGSGSRIKVLESLSFGRPVITTKIGAEGIKIDSPYLTIVPEINPETWVKQIIESKKTISSSDTIILEKLLTKHLWSNTLKPLLQSL